jgi:pimeloyl-ACP methyl ester carboxylesterase
VTTIFTRIINHEIPATFVWRDERCVAFLSINPLAHGHTLVVPIEEVDHWVDAPPPLVAHLFEVTHVIGSALERAFDPARVGVLGGSYGGFMTTWLLARTDRFAAGCSERAVNNLLSEEWSSDEGGHFCRELGLSHLDDPDEYLRMSPVTYVRGITAPILILHSEQDLRCHPEQADALFTALRLLGHPDVEYWRFPGEGHELSRSGSPAHRIRRAELINAFFERTIGGGPR